MGVLSMAELLETQFDGPLTDAQASRVQAILASGSRLHALIDGILRYTALLGDRTPLQHQHCDLDELCAITLNALRPRATAKGQQIEYTLASPGLSTWSDPDGVIQVLKQLLDNAIKFTPDGGRLGLDVLGDAAAGSVRLTVWDAGPGIPAAAQETLFHPFVQADGSLARRHGGIGLGLAYAQRMVERLGGTLSLESQLGQGSRFTVTLPIHEPHA